MKDARARHERGELDAAGLGAVEDGAIERLIRRQEESGLQGVTDGEFRRAFWHYDFLQALDGVETYYVEQGFQFKGATIKPLMLRVRSKLDFSGHPMVDHFRFVKAHTTRTPKMTIPSPSALHFRFGRQAVPEAIYPRMEDFYEDLGAAYSKAVRAFADAGCRYLQLDEVYLAYLCDPEQREGLRQRGDDPDTLPATYARLINASIAQAPADMTIGMHLCRGNFRSTFVASGGYEPVAELLFNDINVRRLLHGVRHRAGGRLRAPALRAEGQDGRARARTTKSGALESKDEIKRRIDQAAEVRAARAAVPQPAVRVLLDRGGQSATEDEQWRKIAFVREVAEEVWGK